jgi:hypothetical protein
MDKPTIEQILAPKPQVQPRLYAYAIAAHASLLEVGRCSMSSAT